RRRGLRDQVLDVERVGPGHELARAADADRVGRGLVVGGREEHLVEARAVGPHLGPYAVPVLLEHTLVVDARDRHLPVAVVDDDRPRPDRVEHRGRLAVAAVAAAEVDAVPPAVGRCDRAVDAPYRAVLERLALVVTGV